MFMTTLLDSLHIQGVLIKVSPLRLLQQMTIWLAAGRTEKGPYVMLLTACPLLHCLQLRWVYLARLPPSSEPLLLLLQGFQHGQGIHTLG